MDEPKYKEIDMNAPMSDLEEGQLKKILDDFQETWNKNSGFKWSDLSLLSQVKTETIIGADEILEGFTPRK